MSDNNQEDQQVRGQDISGTQFTHLASPPAGKPLLSSSSSSVQQDNSATATTTTAAEAGNKEQPPEKCETDLPNTPDVPVPDSDLNAGQSSLPQGTQSTAVVSVDANDSSATLPGTDTLEEPWVNEAESGHPETRKFANVNFSPSPDAGSGDSPPSVQHTQTSLPLPSADGKDSSSSEGFKTDLVQQHSKPETGHGFHEQNLVDGSADNLRDNLNDNKPRQSETATTDSDNIDDVIDSATNRNDKKDVVDMPPGSEPVRSAINTCTGKPVEKNSTEHSREENGFVFVDGNDANPSDFDTQHLPSACQENTSVSGSPVNASGIGCAASKTDLDDRQGEVDESDSVSVQTGNKTQKTESITPQATTITKDKQLPAGIETLRPVSSEESQIISQASTRNTSLSEEMPPKNRSGSQGKLQESGAATRGSRKDSGPEKRGKQDGAEEYHKAYLPCEEVFVLKTLKFKELCEQKFHGLCVDFDLRKKEVVLSPKHLKADVQREIQKFTENMLTDSYELQYTSGKLLLKSECLKARLHTMLEEARVVCHTHFVDRADRAGVLQLFAASREMLQEALRLIENFMTKMITTRKFPFPTEETEKKALRADLLPFEDEYYMEEIPHTTGFVLDVAAVSIRAKYIFMKFDYHGRKRPAFNPETVSDAVCVATPAVSSTNQHSPGCAVLQQDRTHVMPPSIQTISRNEEHPRHCIADFGGHAVDATGSSPTADQRGAAQAYGRREIRTPHPQEITEPRQQSSQTQLVPTRHAHASHTLHNQRTPSQSTHTASTKLPTNVTPTSGMENQGLRRAGIDHTASETCSTISVTKLMALLLQKTLAQRDFFILLGLKQMTVDLSSLKRGHILVTKGDPADVEQLLHECLIQEMVELDQDNENDRREAQTKLESLKQAYQQQLTFSCDEKTGQLSIVFHREIKDKVDPILMNLKIRKKFIHLPMYKISCFHHHQVEFIKNILARVEFKIGLEIKTDGQEFGVCITAPRNRFTEAERVVNAEFAKLVMLESSVNLAKALYLQDISEKKDQALFADSSRCTLSISAPCQPVLLSATAPGGQKLMVCDDSIATTDCDVILLPLFDGPQMYLAPWHKKILESEILPVDAQLYALKVGAPGNEADKSSTLMLRCNTTKDRKVVMIYIPPTDDSKWKDYISSACEEAIRSVAYVQPSTSIALPLAFGADYPAKRVWKTILWAITRCFSCVEEGSQESTAGRSSVPQEMVIKLYTDKSNEADTMNVCQDMEAYLCKSFWTLTSCFPQVIRTASRITVLVEDVFRITVDALVNSTNKELDHSQGNVSSILQKRTGQRLTDECKRLYPQGMVDNEVAVTNSFLENFREIFHIALGGLWKPDLELKLLQYLKVQVKTCLGLASAKCYKTIAFPTLGVGKLGYPPDRVAKAMFAAAQEFFHEMPHSSLEDVFIVCYFHQPAILKAFKAEEFSHKFGYDSPDSPGLTGSVEVEKSVVQIVKGDPVAQKFGADFIVCEESSGGQSEDDQAHMFVANATVVPVCTDEIQKKLKEVADRCDSSKSVQINMKTFDRKFFKDIAAAVVHVMQKVQEIYIFVATEYEFHEFGGLLRKAMQEQGQKTMWQRFLGDKNKVPDWKPQPAQTVGPQEPSGCVRVYGPSAKVQEILLKIIQLKTPQLYYQRAEECMQKLQSGSSVDDKQLHQDYSYSSKSVTLDLQDTSGESETSDICHFTIPLKHVKAVGQEKFSQFWRDKGADILEGFSQRNECMVFKTKLHNLKMAVALICTLIESETEGNRGTSDGAPLKQTANFTESRVEEEVSVYKELSPLEYEALSYLLGGTFTETFIVDTTSKGHVIVGLKREQQSAGVSKLDLIRREDVQLPPDEFNRILNSSLDVKKEEGLEAYIKPLHAEQKVSIFAFDYNTITKAKHLVSVKAGKVKTTSRARRRFDGGQGFGQDDAPLPQSLDTAYAQSMPEFTTRSGIKVLVYKTDITKLPVDAIVNAANGGLNHGGGVAAAIARAAGPELEEEGDAYVRKNGQLKVTEVVATTAGAMTCKKVLHAVGPRWYDYQDKTQCQQDLEQTVFNCLKTAHGLKFSSLAVSSISSAIFGVPKDLCAQMYLSAVKSFVQQFDGVTTLKTIHFVDVSDAMVSIIQDTFTRGWNGGGMPSAGLDPDHKRMGSTSFNDQSNTAAAYSSQLPTTESMGATGGLDHHRPNTFSSAARSQHGMANTQRGQPPVTIVRGGGTQHEDQYQFHFVDLDLIFQKQRITDIQTDAIVVWQYMGNVLKDQDSKTLTKGWRSSTISSLQNKLTEKAVELLTFGWQLIVLPVVPNRGPVVQEKVRSVVEQVLNKLDLKNLKSVAIPYFVFKQVSNQENKDIEEFAAGVYMAVRNYAEGRHRSIKEVHILHTKFEILKAMEFTVSEKMALDRSRVDQGNIQGPQSQSTASVESPVSASVDEGSCVICHGEFNNPKTLGCKHTFCSFCIGRWMEEKPTCPSCGTTYGPLFGDQPEDGTMGMRRSAIQLKGFQDCDTLVIDYFFPSGKQTQKQQNPGRFYHGTRRVCYLPNNEEGRKVLMLLKVAFDRRLTFTVGRLSTTGRDDQVIWNDIHHKTDFEGGPAKHGYPDPGYLARVQDELAAKGVTEKDLTDQQKDFIAHPYKYATALSRDFGGCFRHSTRV